MTAGEFALAAALVVAAYLVGSLSPSVFLGRVFKGVDVREHGSGNPGTTNAFRVLGTGLGIAVLVADVLKGFVPVIAARLMLDDPTVTVFAAMAAILGHNYSIFLRGSGGKGVATGAGTIIAMTPVVFVVLVSAFAVVLLVARVVSLASLTAAVLYPVLMWSTDQPVPYMVFSILGSAVVVYAHRGNIRRIARGEEGRIDIRRRSG